MKNIVLIGMPAVGKSTVGVLTAKTLGFSFIDTDLIIQQNTGRLLQDIIDKDGLDAFDAIESLLPAGTLSGAPKIRACEIIEELERTPRGVYGGALGYVDFNGNLDTCIAIRMAVKKNDKVYVQAGAGIVADSVPESEYEETYNKALAVMNAVKNAGEVNAL